MIMAAGLGTRMRPLTDACPKPMVKVGGKPMLDHVLEKLVAAGIGRAVVNVHYLARMIETHLARRSSPQIIISDERDALLETGGGLARAMPLIAADLFFCLNSDSLWTDGATDVFRQLSAAWDDAVMDALLLLVPLARARNHDGPGDFELGANGQLQRRTAQTASHVFTGIQLVSKRLLRDLPPQDSFSTNILWQRALGEGRLFGTVHDGDWVEVGRPEHIRVAEEILALE
ncbi:nucleotidyltransferase family protein [Croceicoccus sp. F390]|uniref:Nucleotidyltransferase family protein n=1 Tax=Croceicoccus esteveae TaxID=3075597 RepID=A0ABU2ZEM9_9SPHN|nr:nucleotidyltransferase family protein [Croceicoccus sp. F390]MDT0575064.1 nucleotidyltransferase family protein [Croceicoccus sp. F390]